MTTRRSLPRGMVVPAAGVLALVMLIASPGCSVKPVPRTPLTPEMQEELGAAASVPEDVAFYSSTMDVAGRATRIWKSEAVMGLVRLPFVQMMMAEMYRSPGYGQVMSVLHTHPLALEFLPVLKDAVSTEVFLCAGPEMVDSLEAFAGVVGVIQMAGLQAAINEEAGGTGEPDVPAMIDAVLTFKDSLRMPPILVGFKMTDEVAAKGFLDTWLARIGPTPVGAIEKQPLAGGEFHVLELKGESIPAQALDSFMSDLEKERVPEQNRLALSEYLRNSKLTLAVGCLDGYLMLFLGTDTSFIARWGQGPSLAASAELEPLRARHKKGLVSTAYSSARIAELLQWTNEDVNALVKAVVDEIPDDEAPPGLKDRLRADAELLVSGLELPKPSSFLTFSFDNKGVETFSLTRADGLLVDCSEPLSILAHRGKVPISVMASHAAEMPEAYDTMVKWLKKGFGYFEDYVLPKMAGEMDRRQYDKVMDLAMPFLASIDGATRQYLIPAIDGTQSIQLADGNGKVERLPNGEGLAPAVPILRLGAAVRLNDPRKFIKAMEQYFAAIETLIEGIHEKYPGQLPPGLALPSPEKRTVAGGTLYHYNLPFDMGADVFPCALIKDDLLVVASSSNLASEMTEPVPMPTGDVTVPEQAAGEVNIVDFSQLRMLLRKLTDSIFTHMQQRRVIRPDDMGGAMMVKMHIDALWRSMRALRSYHSTTTVDGDRMICHSWLHVEDVSE